MKKLKSMLLIAVAFALLVSPLLMSKVNAAEKVKVYIFEAGGCPYCEAEIEYLEGLDSYNEKFEIVKKELYVDHVDWEEGKDYQLGVKVATAFKDAGFTEASYQGTPFVVISNLYAAATYSTDLESYINQAYSEGDQDVVGCFEKGGTDCLKSVPSDGSETVRNIVLIALLIGGVVIGIISKRRFEEENYSYDDERSYDETEVEEDEDEEVVVPEKKIVAKKVVKKDASKETKQS